MATSVRRCSYSSYQQTRAESPNDTSDGGHKPTCRDHLRACVRVSTRSSTTPPTDDLLVLQLVRYLIWIALPRTALWSCAIFSVERELMAFPLQPGLPSGERFTIQLHWTLEVAEPTLVALLIEILRCHGAPYRGCAGLRGTDHAWWATCYALQPGEGEHLYAAVSGTCNTAQVPSSSTSTSRLPGWLSSATLLTTRLFARQNSVGQLSCQ